ncbi:MAG: hypothetical protein ACTSVV_14740 [Promethearchaeota archaeon]
MDENVWLSGPKELIDHSLEHLKSAEPFDLRIAMISIDNAVELMIKIFLSLNKRNLNIEYKEYKNAIQNFPLMLDLLNKYVSDIISPSYLDEIELLHRIRNHLYHSGIGITISKQVVEKYLAFAKEIFLRLFGINIVFKENEFVEKVGKFLNIWSNFEKTLKDFLLIENLTPFTSKSYLLSEVIEVLYKNGKLDMNFVEEFKRLLYFRNNLVHGTKEILIDTLNKKIQEIEILKKKLLCFMNKQ